MNNNYYFNNKNILSCYTREDIKNTWNELLQKKDKNENDFIVWHLKYTPWFSKEINEEIGKIEYNNILKQEKL